MIAYHFPPLSGSSGIQRTLRFVQHLPPLGWQPLVLSADPRCYEQTGDDLMADIPQETVVRRAFALDTARHLSAGGRYLGWMARPDRWVSWRFAAIAEGLRMIKQFKPDVIWSTYPIATAHLIGAALHHRSGLPWIADFRDPMAQDGYPADMKTWQSYKRIEEEAIRLAHFCVFTTPGAARTYRSRYPAARDRIVVLENGFDEESFLQLVSRNESSDPLLPGGVLLLHSGIVYPEERDPRPLFVAMRRLVESSRLRPSEMRIRFRAAVHDQWLNSLAAELGVKEFIELCPPIAYREALAEMLRADALLVLQSTDCNDQIPAKLYEYLRAGRPILGLTDPEGDTAGALREAGLDTIARLESADEIEVLLPKFLISVMKETARLPLAATVARASRRGRAESLAHLIESCC
ncbi:MAG TPA: glycosyltransferase [Rhodocyclaceae bacterium]|nr:glycosyltransferase [Rhodocyclaceae bacterium]HUY02664.1 glycosyltransferase [Rhodocyclaceae bacterium]